MQQQKVIIFTTPTCSFCTAAKRYFREKNVRFTEVDVSRDASAARDIVRRTAQMGVPVILINNRPIVGFDQPTIDRLLNSTNLSMERTMTIQPLDDRVLAVPDNSTEEMTPGGLIIPDTAKEKPRTGSVVAVGTDDGLKEKVKAGDKILFAKYGGEEIQVDNVEHRIVQRSDILAVVKN